MRAFDQELDRRLAAFADQGLRRSLRRVDSPQGSRIRVGGREFLNFSSNDYLGLAKHPALQEAVIQAIERFGAGSGASRLICGSLAPHHELEEALAAFKGTEAALTFSNGYATALGTIPALVGKDDVVVMDKLVHACIVDAARLSGAKLRVFAHNDLNDLERILKWTNHIRGPGAEGRGPNQGPHVLVVTESVFSMDGDLAPLREIAELKDHFGAWLMVDEAHATGLFGPSRRGLVEEFGLAGRVEVQMGTLGKALGAAGGYVAGSRALVDFLVNRARSFIISTAPVPAAAAAARAALSLVQSEEGRERCERLRARVAEARAAFPANLVGCRPDAGATVASPISPWIIGSEAEALRVAAALWEQGICIPAIRFPTVARGSARLRLTLSADHTAEEVARVSQAITALAPPPVFPIPP
jgi:8-amino-7-oxononanoate synthase